MLILEFIINLLTTPNHYFAESFILDFIGVLLIAEEFVLNLFG